MELIDKADVVSKINSIKDNANKLGAIGRVSTIILCNELLDFLNDLEVKELDFDTLDILADHLITCDAHGISPKYNEKELDLLERIRNNKA